MSPYGRSVCCRDDYDFSKHKTGAFDGQSDMPPCNPAIFASFASHLTESYEIYLVEVKDITAEMVELRDRKGKAAVIAKVIKQIYRQYLRCTSI